MGATIAATRELLEMARLSIPYLFLFGKRLLTAVEMAGSRYVVCRVVALRSNVGMTW